MDLELQFKKYCANLRDILKMISITKKCKMVADGR